MFDNVFKDSAHKFTYFYSLALDEQRRLDANGASRGFDMSHPEAGDPRTWFCFGAIVGGMFGPLYYNQHPFWVGVPAGAMALGVPMMAFAFFLKKTAMMIGAMIKALRMALGFLNGKTLGVLGTAWRGAKWGTGLGIITMIAQDNPGTDVSTVATGASVGIMAGAGFQGIKLLISRMRGN